MATRVGKNIAYAFMMTEVPDGAPLQIDVLGRCVPAKVTDRGLYDPQMALVRAG